jgi:hypothetical protein
MRVGTVLGSVYKVILNAFLKDTDFNVRVKGLFRQEIRSLERPAFMTALHRTRSPVRAMRRFADWGGSVSTTAPFNHGSEIAETARLRPAN